MKYLFLLLAVFLLETRGASQIVYHQATDTHNIEEIMPQIDQAFVLYDSLNNIGFSTTRADIFKETDRTFLLIDGTLDVYIWKGSSWENLYLRDFKGYNYGSKKFISDGKIYSFGGYGYWNQHGQIIYFLEERGEWEILPFSTDFPNGLASYEDGELNMFLRSSIYQVIIPTKTYSIFEYNGRVQRKETLQNSLTFELRDYTFNINEKPTYLYSKGDRTLYQSHLSPFKNVREGMKNGFVCIVGNDMYVYDRSGVLLSKYNGTEELEYFDSLRLVFENNWSNYYIFLFIGLVLGGVVFIYRKRLRNRYEYQAGNRPELTNLRTDERIERLIPYSGQLLKQEELDEIFEISDFNSPENIRYQRSRFIKETNRMGQTMFSRDIIVRKKDPEDKRRFIYAIENLENLKTK